MPLLLVSETRVISRELGIALAPSLPRVQEELPKSWPHGSGGGGGYTSEHPLLTENQLGLSKGGIS